MNEARVYSYDSISGIAGNYRLSCPFALDTTRRTCSMNFGQTIDFCHSPCHSQLKMMTVILGGIVSLSGTRPLMISSGSYPLGPRTLWFWPRRAIT
ncbi:hypothetical protein K435DRAFT_374476 [Dendrothele bispora CBS 962.96]|uniref:Uncharacterized protein n=1 Tax=Dendrothele bispora (strain CBS 962.96) TaxID=1314807 RepID=A0A4S8LAY2_DENBC|nr:hypothetical protein K435DRAFT_374476 [Dendrothele bispora CBS 962.96]